MKMGIKQKREKAKLTKPILSKSTIIFDEENDFYLSNTDFMANVKRASARGEIEWTLTPEELHQIWIAQNGRCYFTGLKLFSHTTANVRDWSIDRISNDLGYVKENIVLCHKAVNMSRGTLSVDAFIQMAKKIAEHRVEKTEQDEEKIKEMMNESLLRISNGITAGDPEKDTTRISYIRKEMKSERHD